MLRRLHLGNDFHFGVVPQHDSVVKCACDNLRVVENLLARDSFHFRWFEDNDLEDWSLMPFHILSFHSLLDAERFHEKVGMHDQASLWIVNYLQSLDLRLVI